MPANLALVVRTILDEYALARDGDHGVAHAEMRVEWQAERRYPRAWGALMTADSGRSCR